MSECVAVVTGGGTSGHVLPALAVADALVAAGVPHAAVHYVGTVRGKERDLLPPTGYAATYLDVVGLQRSLSRRNLAVLPKAFGSVRAARRLLRQLRPKVVVNVGGYGSFPATLAARLARVPIVVVSYDRRPGLVSRLFAKRAALVATAFDDSPLPGATLTGGPVGQAVLAVERRQHRGPARRTLDLPDDRFVVAVVGGSQGSAVLNAAVAGVVQARRADRGLAVVHVVGERNLATAPPGHDGSDGILYRVLGYTNDIPAIYAAADLLVTRGGAGTICELAAVGAPAVLCPWAGAAENHQVDNVRSLTDVGAAISIDEANLDGVSLDRTVEQLRAEPARLAAMAQAAYAAGAIHRSGRLAASILEVAGR